MTTEERAAHIAQEFGSTKANKESSIYRACIRMAAEEKEALMEEITDRLYDFVVDNFHIHTSEGDYDWGEQTIEYCSDRTAALPSDNKDWCHIIEDFKEKVLGINNTEKS